MMWLARGSLKSRSPLKARGPLAGKSPWGFNDGFSPARLFVAGQVGAWYDPSDLTTLFQDAAGTTPVIAVEQPVGLMLDKSGRGNHASQSTSAARPTLRARYNQLLNTTTLATQSVTVVAAAHTLRFIGAGSITLSGTASGTYSAGSHSITPTAGTLTLTVSGTVTDADLRVANESASLPVYQRVGAATDYDTSGFPPYLAFDGSDDAMATSAINFSATDKMSMFAGVRKIGSAASMLVEFSADWNSNQGTFVAGVNTDGTITTTTDVFASRGTAAANTNQFAVSGGFAAPVSLVYTNTANISGGLTTIRINGAASGTNGTGGQGTGNFGNHPLYIGARNNAASFLNGRLYSLIVLGRAATAAEIVSTERWVGAKAGVVL